MNNLNLNRRIALAFGALGLASVITASSVSAAVVWDLNPNNLNQPAGSSSVTYTQGGTTLTAYGFDNLAGGRSAPHELFFKNVPTINGAVERGLGITGGDNEVQTTNGVVNNYIQLDLSAIIAAGYVNGQISVGSVQTGESFQLFGSNQLGVLGAQLGVFGSQFDDQFVAIPGFGTFQFISVASVTGDVLPIAFRADITPVPEMSALLPVVGLLSAIACVEMFRRRRAVA